MPISRCQPASVCARRCVWVKARLARVLHGERQRRAAMAWGRQFPQIERALGGVRQATPEERPRLLGHVQQRARGQRCARRLALLRRAGQIIGVGVEEHRVNLLCLVGADHPTSAPRHKAATLRTSASLAHLGANWADVQKVAAGGSQSIQCPQPHFLLITGFGVMARLALLSPTVPAVFNCQSTTRFSTGKERSACQEYTWQGVKSQGSAPKWARPPFSQEHCATVSLQSGSYHT